MNVSYPIPAKGSGFYLTMFLSVLVGFMVFKLSYLGPRWILSGIGALIFLLISVAIPNVKGLFLTLFFLSLPVGATNFLGSLDDFHYGGAPGLYHTIYDFFLLVLYLFWLPGILIKKKEKISICGADICFWLIILMAFLSLHNAVAIHFSFYEIIRLVLMYCIFLYVSNLREREDLNFVIVPLLCGLLVETIIGIIQYTSGGFLGLALLGEKSDPMMFSNISRVGGTMGHPNGFARYLGFIIPLTISLQLAPLKIVHRWLCMILSILSTVVLILTFSRAAWGGFGVSLMVILWLGMVARLISGRKVFLLLVTGLLILSVLIFSFKDVIALRLFSDDAGSMASRIPQFEIATNIIKTHPLIGIGINNYAEVMHLFDHTSERITTWFPNVVHNVYLLIASEIGIPGLCFFMLFIFLFFKTGFQILKSHDELMKALGIGLMAGVTSFLIQIMVMPPTMTSLSFLFFWVWTGLMFAIKRQKENSEILMGYKHD
jgi:O-antigen ligase